MNLGENSKGGGDENVMQGDAFDDYDNRQNGVNREGSEDNFSHLSSEEQKVLYPDWGPEPKSMPASPKSQSKYSKEIMELKAQIVANGEKLAAPAPEPGYLASLRKLDASLASVREMAESQQAQINQLIERMKQSKQSQQGRSKKKRNKRESHHDDHPSDH